MTTQYDPSRNEFSGGINNAVIWPLRKPNEVEDSINGRFNELIGAISRRLGYTAEGSALQANKRGSGLHEAKWDSGARLLAAINNSGDTETKIKIYDSGANTWSNLTLPNTLDRDTRVQMIDSLGETYVAGYSATTNTRMELINILSTGVVSDDRNLIGAPDAKFIVEYIGRLYALNVKTNGTVYVDRAYRSSGALGIVTFTQGDQDVFDVLNVDSVRYLKAGMAFDIYTAGTSTKTHDITITSVDKAADSITYSGFSTATTFATTDVNTGTDVITIGRNLATGTPVKITSTTTVPAGLVSGTTYYAINVSATTIKLAISRSNATAGTAVDITSQGTGTHTITSGSFIPDNTEIWLDGRHGELSYLWNTDYRTEETADFIRIQPGVDSDSEITGYAKTNNRLLIFTPNSTHKWDNSNFSVLYEDIGCIAHDTIQNIGDWVIWLDSEGNVQARNDATGQDEIISRPIQKLLDGIPTSQLKDASAGVIGKVYKLCLGTVNGEILRLSYDFNTNTWSHETHKLSMTSHARSDMNGTKKLYFLGSDGQMYEDETGYTDNGTTIPFSVTLGRYRNSTNWKKNYHGIDLMSENLKGASIKATVDGLPDSKDVGQITEPFAKVPFSGINGQMSGRDINVTISLNTQGETPCIYSMGYYLNAEEDKFGQPT